MSGHRRDPRRSREKKPLSNGWIVVPSKTYPDRVYFYNTVTRCSTWENPCEDRSDAESNNSSSELPERNHSFRTKRKQTAAQSRKKKSETILHSPVHKNCNTRINSEIEDYDEHDEYFTDIPINSFSSSRSQIISPPSSPESVSSIKSCFSDVDNSLIENNKKQLWDHFVSNPDKPKVKKSVALSDFPVPSTSHNFGMEKTDDSSKTNSNSFRNRIPNRKKRQKESEKKSMTEKITKNVSFKRSDKTPAQTRLLKLRKQNAEKLKKLATKYPELGIPAFSDKQLKKSKTNVVDLNEQQEGAAEAYLRQTSIFSGVQNNENLQGVDYCEEMDWEPSSEESDVRNINVFRQQVENANAVSGDNFFGLNSDHISALPTKTHSWFLVLDTNIFVSCLPFVRELRDTKVTDLGYPVIYVPWRVLQELDHLKDIKIDTDRNLNVNVRRAIGYLNDNFKSRHPRVFGQSFEDFAKMIDLNTFAPDDEILQTCIQLQKQHGGVKLMLLTNDRNLESKAIVSGVEVYSKETFQKKYLKSSSGSSQFIESDLSKPSSGEADDCLCQVKELLKEFLTMVVETEMRIAFEGDWVKLAVKKPPWSLQDVMKCLLKHWRSVFFLSFSRDTQSEAELLYEQLFKKEAVSTQDVADIIKTIQRLMASIKKSQRKKRPYLDVLPTEMSKLSNLLSSLTPNQNETHPSSFPSVSGSNFNSQPVSQKEPSDIAEVMALFKEIWESLRGFCCSLSDVIQTSVPNAEIVVQEVRPKVSQILNEVTELVACVEKILEMNSADISECHPVIVHFSNFLITVYPNMVPNLKNELPKCLAAFFTDFEGRSLIGTALGDFREFMQDLSKVAEYFNPQYNC